MTQDTVPFTLAVPINSGDHFLGPASARVTLVEYGDFECPACAQAYHAVNILLKHFGNDVGLVFRHFPLREIHPHAELAAEAAEAAGAQNKFWPMHNLLFENQSQLKASNLQQYADRGGLDLPRFDYEMRDHIHLQRVREHIQSGDQCGVRATPTFFVNGVVCDTSYGYEHLRTAIDTALRA